MIVTKHYENDHVTVDVEEGGRLILALTLDSELQMRRLGRCLIDLANTGGRKVCAGEEAKTKETPTN